MFRALGVAAFGLVGCGRMAFEPFEPVDSNSCLGSLVRVCSATLTAATPVMVENDLDIDTDTSPMCNQDNDKMSTYCVVTASDFEMAGTARISAHGSKPLVLLATGTIQLRATIDVSSKHDSADPGAGANPSVCGLGGTDPQDEAGGGFGCPVGFLVRRCRVFRTSEVAAREELGTRSVAFMAAPVETVEERSRSSPRRSTSMAKSTRLAPVASEAQRGGGGGGSGGMIVLDAPVIVAQPNGSLFANGGGGGEGGSATSEGRAGGESAGPGLPAPGGIEPNDFSNGMGGSGSSGAMLDGEAGETGASTGGSGGGGGGAGFIHAPGVDPNAVSPPSTDPAE